jgi:CRISPR-associated protein Csy3
MAKDPKAAKTPIPNLLAFERSINTTDGLLWGRSGDDWKPVQVETRGAKGVIGPKNAVFDPPSEKDVRSGEKGLGKNAHVPNLQRGDDARLPHDATALRLTYGVMFGPHALRPVAIDGHSAFGDAFRTFIDDFVDRGGFAELAWRYAYRVLDGGSAWRNLQVVHDARIRAERADGAVLYDGPLMARCPVLDDAAHDHVRRHAPGLVDGIAKALSGQGEPLFVRVSLTGESFPGAPVWPSQLLDKRKDAAGNDISRVLMSVEANGVDRQAAISSQKIANPIRRIDGWHGLDIPDLPAEVYGQNLAEMKAFRTGRTVKSHNPTFYAVLEALARNEPFEWRHALYAVAVLVRGGVFSEVRGGVFSES